MIPRSNIENRDGATWVQLPDDAERGCIVCLPAMQLIPVTIVENVSRNTDQKELINIIRKEYTGYTFTPALNELLRRKGL